MHFVLHTAGHAPCFNLDPKRHEKRLPDFSCQQGQQVMVVYLLCSLVNPVYTPPPGKKHVPWVEGIVSTEQHDKK